MLSKQSLKAEFEKDYKTYYEVELFRREGFSRHKCATCGKAFWSASADADNCGDSAHNDYSFIGKRRGARKLDYAQFWRKFAKFWKKNGHDVIPRFPVISRWRDDLYFTIASIVDFQRLERGKVVFEYAHNPLVVPQICLRFVDIANVGVTGRHLSCFTMAGQHAFVEKGRKGGYWKDECIQYNYDFLTEVLRIPQNEISYGEDLWAMPDFSAYGPSMESFSGGLELVNSVFMNYRWSNGRQEELDTKVIDVGWGFERLLWFYNGTPSVYDSLFPKEVGFMKKKAGVEIPEKLFTEYSRLASKLNIEEVANIGEEKKRIASALGLSLEELEKTILPLQGIYAIADHSRALLFALSDGALPSNTAGGYNLRVLARRAFSFIEDYGFDFSLCDIMEMQARDYKAVFPELSENLDAAKKILDAESRKYAETAEKARKTAGEIVKAGSVSSEKMMLLYESHGLTPEIIERVAKRQGAKVEVPTDFYHKLTEKHVMEDGRGKKHALADDEKFRKLPKTRALYYEDVDLMEFGAEVQGIFGNSVVLDATAFYPEGGGQRHDTGEISGARVKKVEKIDDVILHHVDDAGKLRVGEKISGRVNAVRRKTIMRHHTATHLVLQSAMRVLGPQVWQAGSNKDEDEAHIDITHYERPSRQQIQAIEKMVNEKILEKIPVTPRWLDRGLAERKYGFRLYQGSGAISKTLRIVDIRKFDVECCGGTHVHTTQDLGSFKIKSVEQVQDGVIRLRYVAGMRALEYSEKNESLVQDSAAVFSVQPEEIVNVSRRFFEEWKQRGNEIDRAHRQLAENLAFRLVDEAKKAGHNHLDRKIDLPAPLLEKVAVEISAHEGISACLHNGQGHIACAANEKSGQDASELLKKKRAKGGGNKGFARGKIQQ
ncbi:MAG: alanine--tRNA ligase [Candidatus Micrarchaeota archaeon]